MEGFFLLLFCELKVKTMNRTSYSQQEGERVIAFLKPLENQLIFKLPKREHEFIAERVVLAPFETSEFDVFKNEFNSMFGAEWLINKHSWNRFRIAIIAGYHVLNETTINAHEIFDVYELNSLGVAGFNFPENILEN